jgi:hypothetical protein
LTLALRSRDGGPGVVLPRALRRFACARGGDIRLDLSADPPPVPRREDLLFDSGAVWRVHALGQGLLYSFRTRALDPPLYKAVAIDSELRRGTLHFPRPARGRRPRYALDFPLDELLFQHRFAREGAAEVHAAGLAAGSGALLFCGRSGAGKSTTARLWRRHRPGAEVLSDDRIVIRRARGRLMAHGTPWHGEGGFAAPLGRPLRAVFFLAKARRTEALRLAPPAAAARLFARSFPPPWDREAIGRVLETCALVSLEVPCYELRFRPDRSAVDAVLELLGAS